MNVDVPVIVKSAAEFGAVTKENPFAVAAEDHPAPQRILSRSPLSASTTTPSLLAETRASIESVR
jgi:hypothetical protein